jgi:hypothetical protein
MDASLTLKYITGLKIMNSYRNWISPLKAKLV